MYTHVGNIKIVTLHVFHMTTFHVHTYHIHLYRQADWLTLGLYLISSPRSKELDFFESPMILNLPTLLGFFPTLFPPSRTSFPDDENTGSENRSFSLYSPPRPDFVAPPLTPPTLFDTCGSENRSSSKGESSVCLLAGRGEGERERDS